MHQKLLNIHKITFSGVYIALIVGLQVALSPLPNIETVTLFLIVGAVNLPLILMIEIGFSFVILEMLIYGFGTWFFFYLIIWPFLIIGTLILRPIIKKHWWMVILWATFFSLIFGTIDAMLKGLLFGTSGLLAYWFQGLIFDLIHAISNFLILFCCYLPVTKIVSLFSAKFQDNDYSKVILKRWLIFNHYLLKQRINQKWNKVIAN